MFGALRPGGTLVAANFAPNLPDIGYMESIMDWKLIYRDEAAMSCIPSLLSEQEVAESHLRRDVYRNVIYLTIRKC